MQDTLTEYQAATLQVMGISVWKLNTDKTKHQPTDTPSHKAHSNQWQSDNAAFITDVRLAIDDLRGGSENVKSEDLKWLESDSNEFSVNGHKIYAPLELASLTVLQKRQLWKVIQQSFSHAN